MPTRMVASSCSSHFSYETLADQNLIHPQLANMAKKRKIESKTEAAASSETVSFTEESVEEEPATDPPNETTAEGSSAPEDFELINEESFVVEETLTQVLESSDPVPDDFVAGDAPPADVSGGGHADEEDGDDPESLKKLLEPLSKEQLVLLLHDAALKHPDLWASIRQSADADPAYRKVFVHGLGWNTTTETLSSFFRQYGEIEDCKAVVDKITGKSKGYGFILFKHRSGARRALKEPQKKMGNRLASCQLASIGPVPAPPPVLPASEYTQRKIYVSNVGADLDPQKIQQFFLKYGEIEEGPLGLDKATGKPKGFCLFVYKSVESARKALEEPHKNFEGHILHCQKAIDGPKPNKQGVYLPPVSGQYAVGQYAGLHQGPSGFGARVPQYVRNDGAVPMGAMSSSIGGPGHLIAPPAASMGFNQTGVVVNNGALAMKSTYGNQVGGAGGYVKTGVMGGYGASAQMHGSYGGAPITQGTARTQQGPGHIGGVGSYMGH